MNLARKKKQVVEEPPATEPEEVVEPVEAEPEEATLEYPVSDEALALGPDAPVYPDKKLAKRVKKYYGKMAANQLVSFAALAAELGVDATLLGVTIAHDLAKLPKGSVLGGDGTHVGTFLVKVA